MRNIAATLGFLLLAACSKSPVTPETPPDPGTDPVVAEPEGEGEERPKLSAAECEAQGGQVIGDIGDGAIHRPEYSCPDSGAAPIGTITADPDGPIAVEGAVCCL